MEDGGKNGVTEGMVEEEVDENVETNGGLRTRSRKNRLLEKEGETAGDAAGDGQPVGEQGRSVYLDQGRGIWKCRHCIWTYQMNNFGIDHIQNHEGFCQGVIDVETLSLHGSLFDSQIKGTKFLDEANGMGLDMSEQFVTDKNLQNCETDCITEHTEDISIMENHNHPRNLSVKTQQTHEEECRRALTGIEARSENHQRVVLPQGDKVIVEMDLERILEEQDTHDLYCPNCHSCITKRVILRKRKRTPRENLSDAKREKTEPVEADVISIAPAVETPDESQDTEPDIFRCLSCLSFFIPTDTGFRLFKNFGKREKNENVQSSQQMPGRSQNWMLSLFELMKGKNKGSKSEDQLLGGSHDGFGAQAADLRKKEKQITSGSSMSEATLSVKRQGELKEKRKDATEENSAAALGVRTPANLHAIIEENVATKKECLADQENSQISLGPDAKKEAKTYTGEKLTNDTQRESARNGSYKGNEVNKVSICDPPSQLGKDLPGEIKIVAALTEQQSMNVSDVIARQVEHVKQDSVKYIQIPPNQEVFLFEKKRIVKAEQLHVPREGGKGDGIIPIPEEMVETTQEIYLEGPSKSDIHIPIPVAPDLTIHSETQTHFGEQTMAEARKAHQWDVLKAIVYGGLLESIESLGVVSSAAGSDVTTLNVVALGLANLFGGLLVVIHNLIELKKEQYKSIDKKEEADRYWELLGRRGYFWLHATVALLSFILVGTLPPVVYGFSFRKSENKEYKLIAVAVASLLCIALLAIGKAHVQEGHKPYVKALLYYVGLGVAASGLSYAVGMLIKKLLEKLGLFDDMVVVPTPVSSILEVTSRTPSWQSY